MDSIMILVNSALLYAKCLLLKGEITEAENKLKDCDKYLKKMKLDQKVLDNIKQEMKGNKKTGDN